MPKQQQRQRYQQVISNNKILVNIFFLSWVPIRTNVLELYEIDAYS